MRVLENLRADMRDIMEVGRKILDRHLSSIRGYTGGKLLRR